jgi:hypothetical protein
VQLERSVRESSDALELARATSAAALASEREQLAEASAALVKAEEERESLRAQVRNPHSNGGPCHSGSAAAETQRLNRGW